MDLMVYGLCLTRPLSFVFVGVCGVDTLFIWVCGGFVV